MQFFGLKLYFFLLFRSLWEAQKDEIVPKENFSKTVEEDPCIVCIALGPNETCVLCDPKAFRCLEETEIKIMKSPPKKETRALTNFGIAEPKLPDLFGLSLPEPTYRPQTKKQCKFFQQNRCKFGSKCHFSHDVSI